MSIWKEIKQEDDINFDKRDDTIDVLYDTDNTGNYYISIPVEFIRNLIQAEEIQLKKKYPYSVVFNGIERVLSKEDYETMEEHLHHL